MPRNESGVFSRIPGTEAVADTTISSAAYNATIEDLVADANAARPQASGGTGATTLGAATVTPTGGSTAQALASQLPLVPESFGAIGDGVASDRAAVAAWLDSFPNWSVYQTTANELGHPNTRQPVSVTITSTYVPGYVVNDVTDVRVSGDFSGTAPLRVGEVKGFFVQDARVSATAFSFLIKPGIEGGVGDDTKAEIGWAEDGVVSRLLVAGSGDNTDVGISIDGDTRNVIVANNVVRHVLRADAGDGHAFALAGNFADVATFSDAENVLFMGNAISDVRVNGYHTEDACRRTGFCFNVLRDVQHGIDIATGSSPSPRNQLYIGNMMGEVTDYFINAVGVGSTENTVYAFNVMDDSAGTLTESYAVRINQAPTKNIRYIGNIHAEMGVSVIESSAEGPLLFSSNVFEDITGIAVTLVRAPTVAVFAHNSFDGVSTAAISANATGIFAPTGQRGVLIESNNTFQGTTPLVKAASANVIGDQVLKSPEMSTDTAADHVLLVAPRAGWVTGVVRLTTSAAGDGTGTCNFSIVKTNGGGTTTIISNTIPTGLAQYTSYLWTGQDAQVAVNAFARGDVIRVTCDGGSSGATKFVIQLDFFYHD